MTHNKIHHYKLICTPSFYTEQHKDQKQTMVKRKFNQTETVDHITQAYILDIMGLRENLTAMEERDIKKSQELVDLSQLLEEKKQRIVGLEIQLESYKSYGQKMQEISERNCNDRKLIEDIMNKIKSKNDNHHVREARLKQREIEIELKEKEMQDRIMLLRMNYGALQNRENYVGELEKAYYQRFGKN